MNSYILPGFKLLTEKVATPALHDCVESSESDPARCHPDTRVAILADLEEWAAGPTYNYPIRRVSGSAGVGKTTILRTTAENLKSRNLLLASFFFWRAHERCNCGEFFIATLAYQIAISIPATRQYIERAVEEDERLCIMYVDPSRRPPLMFTNHIEHNQVQDKLKKLQSGSKPVETICSSVDSQGPVQVASQPTADDLYEILYN